MPKQKFDETLSPIAVANYLLRKGRAMEALKLIKIVYLCHAWHIATGRGPLLSEKPQAWRYGPMLPSLHFALMYIGRNSVRSPIPESLQGEDDDSAEPTPQQAEFIDNVYDHYIKYSADELSDLLNGEETPWHKVWMKHKWNAPIPDELIFADFEERLNGGKAQKIAQ